MTSIPISPRVRDRLAVLKRKWKLSTYDAVIRKQFGITNEDEQLKREYVCTNPKCKNLVYKSQRFCDKCGEKFDWNAPEI